MVELEAELGPISSQELAGDLWKVGQRYRKPLAAVLAALHEGAELLGPQRRVRVVPPEEVVDRLLRYVRKVDASATPPAKAVEPPPAAEGATPRATYSQEDHVAHARRALDFVRRLPGADTS
ncbi:hypothetical protein [Sorangium sp. So ce131]|uniref:hypothetical protein n=1 Tax=Sorangium sp. So ce131 TaxID=3133282 RepID=UPI003F60A233